VWRRQYRITHHYTSNTKSSTTGIYAGTNSNTTGIYAGAIEGKSTRLHVPWRL